jgi:hypothetical protein
MQKSIRQNSTKIRQNECGNATECQSARSAAASARGVLPAVKPVHRFLTHFDEFLSRHWAQFLVFGRIDETRQHAEAEQRALARQIL